MMEATPRTLRSMLAESKDSAELMVNLAYGAVFAHDPAMAAEVNGLWSKLTALVHRMRVVAVLAGRRAEEAQELASVLGIIGAIEDIGRDAVDIARVAAPPVGIPRILVAALCAREAAEHRLEAPLAPPEFVGDPAVIGLDHAVDVLVEMKTVSEVAVGLAYAALVVDDESLAREVQDLAGQLDEMKDRLQRWVLRAAATDLDDSGLQALLQLAQTAEDLGDRAAEMVRPLVEGDEVHPVLALALGETDDVAVQAIVREGSSAGNAPVRDLESGTGMDVLAVRRHGRYQYRPPADMVLQTADEVFASGPSGGRSLLLARCGMG